MAITVAGRDETIRTGTASLMTWVHSVGTAAPAGVLVAVVHGASATDHVNSVGYGTLVLTRAVRNTDGATEAGATEWWFAGSGVPTGGQTVTVNLNSATGDDIFGMSLTLASSRNLLTVATSGVDGNTPNPSVGLVYGGEAKAFAAMYSGLTAHSSILAGTGCTKVSTSELAGNFTCCVIEQNSMSASNFTIAASAADDDVAFSAVAISEAGLAAAQALAATQLATALYQRGIGNRQLAARQAAAPAFGQAAIIFRNMTHLFIRFR